MVIFLPLLFADGQPTSLERITVNQLEKFIPFMLTCCPGVSVDAKPPWWPASVPYPILHNTSTPQSALKEVICKCYEFYESEHVLRFCSRLAELPPGALKYKEASHQGFVSIYNKMNNKLIVTFKKKNQVYDRPTQNLSPYKKLLIRKPVLQPPREPQIEDIYLCNYCDEEFTTANDAIAHEGICKGKEEVHSEAIDQVSVMRFLGLCPTQSSSPGTSHSSKRGTSVRLTARSYMQVPISSPLGLKMKSNVSPIKGYDEMEYRERIEMCCSTNYNRSVEASRRYRRPKQPFRFAKRKRTEFWAHSYCFNKAQKAEKRLTLKTGLNKRARTLLAKCKPCIVRVEKSLSDPLAIHAAASLKIGFSYLKNSKPDNCVDIRPNSPAICIDLTIDDSDNSDEKSDSRNSPNIYFSSPNHNSSSVTKWIPYTKLPSLSPQCLLQT